MLEPSLISTAEERISRLVSELSLKDAGERGHDGRIVPCPFKSRGKGAEVSFS